MCGKGLSCELIFLHSALKVFHVIPIVAESFKGIAINGVGTRLIRNTDDTTFNINNWQELLAKSIYNSKHLQKSLAILTDIDRCSLLLLWHIHPTPACFYFGHSLYPNTWTGEDFKIHFYQQ